MRSENALCAVVVKLYINQLILRTSSLLTTFASLITYSPIVVKIQAVCFYKRWHSKNFISERIREHKK